MDRETQMDNPCPGWLSDTSWDNITELDKLTNFHDIITSFEQYPRDWLQWYTSATPETAVLPGDKALWKHLVAVYAIEVGQTRCLFTAS